MPQELELKLTLTPEALEIAHDWLGRQEQSSHGKTRTLINQYYDTPAADLNRQRAALRVRQTGDGFIQTLKSRGDFEKGAHRREEHEWNLSTPELDTGLLVDTPVSEKLDLTKLAPVFKTDFQRRILMVDDGEAVIECAFDSGVIRAGSRELALHELELELKSGGEQRLLHWATQIAGQVPVFLNLISKAEQGYYHAGLRKPGLPDAPEALERLLRGLSVCWLTGEDTRPLAEALDLLRDRAECSDLLAEWQWLRQKLEAGVRPDELMNNPDLGRLQLGLLSDR
ncbi:CYTH domain-containing protein [Marinobacter sp.]|uniref:CYTH domain-containing protein n=1 Tax=Marinobacter sp. TaxID=50741 RepID=UPI00384CA006